MALLSADLLALQRLAGNAAVAHLLRQQAPATDAGATATDGGSVPSSGAIGVRTHRPIADLVRDFRAMAAASRSKGYPIAADNLQHFLDGHGATKAVPLTWLRGFGVVTDAENKNQGRFEKQLDQQARALAAGATSTFADHWDAKISAGATTELFYASGASELSSAGTFSFTRIGSVVTITGIVEQRWHDPYDWNAKMGAYIPGFGIVSDNVGLDLTDAGAGHPYLLENRYTQTVSGTYTFTAKYRPNTSSYTWSGP
jgi:hypothetical protein